MSYFKCTNSVINMCTSSNNPFSTNGGKQIKKPKGSSKGTGEMVGQEYFQIQKGCIQTSKQPPPDKVQHPRRQEKIVYVLATVGVIILSHVLTWGHFAIPFIFAVGTPLLIGIKTVLYWGHKWQFFMLDFCYFANTLTYIFLWLPENEHLFRMAFALANGPVLVAAAVYRNSLVYHHHDKITSCYIHFLPAMLTFCVRWFPVHTSRFWFQEFTPEVPQFDTVWLYAIPFAFFFLHSVLYFFIVNIAVKPKDPYVTSYGYLAEKFSKLNCLGGYWGQCFVFYGLNWLFCLSSLPLALLSYVYFPVHCVSLFLVFLVVVWNGGSFYVHVFSVRGFSTMD